MVAHLKHFYFQPILAANLNATGYSKFYEMKNNTAI